MTYKVNLSIEWNVNDARETPTRHNESVNWQLLHIYMWPVYFYDSFLFPSPFTLIPSLFYSFSPLFPPYLSLFYFSPFLSLFSSLILISSFTILFFLFPLLSPLLFVFYCFKLYVCIFQWQMVHVNIMSIIPVYALYTVNKAPEKCRVFMFC